MDTNLQDVIKLATVGIALSSKKIRLCGEELIVGTAMVSTEGRDASLMLELRATDADASSHEDACDCPICRTSRALTKRNLPHVCALIAQGRSDIMVMDSSCHTEGNFHVKITHTPTGKSAVASGSNMTLAITLACEKALRYA